MPGARDAHSAADATFHNVTAAVYEARLMPIFAVFFPLVIDRQLDALAAGARGGTVLDVGCGTGAIALRLAERGLRVHGIDHSAGMLAMAEQEARRRGLQDRVTFELGDARELSFDDASFAGVACHGVLHHLTDIRPPLEEIARVLCPGGRFSTAEPCLGSPPTEPLWNGLRKAVALTRRRPPPSAPAPASTDDPPADFVDEHEEGHIDANLLLATCWEVGLKPRAEYWTRFEGMHYRPPRTQALLNRELTRPWRHRRGNLVFVVAERAGADYIAL